LGIHGCGRRRPRGDTQLLPIQSMLRPRWPRGCCAAGGQCPAHTSTFSRKDV
jgi:hypothetical protein